MPLPPVRHAEVMEAARMPLHEKVERWQHNLAEPSQLPARALVLAPGG
jgi:hypothetical protein